MRSARASRLHAEPLTAKRLREVLHYHPETGEFRWLISPAARTRAGSVAGSDNGEGYLSIGFRGVRYFAHRLAWLYMTGAWPTFEVDHWDTDSTNNAWTNLRDVPHVTNQHNRQRAQSSSATGVLGVYPIANSSRFGAKIKLRRRSIYLGSFDTVYEASLAYLAAKKVYHSDAVGDRAVPKPPENKHWRGMRVTSWAPIISSEGPASC